MTAPREDRDDPGRCVCCALPVTSCGKAVAEAQAAEKRKVRRRRTGFEPEAAYPGTCVDCNTYFSAGTLIEWDDELGGWRSLDCCP